MQLEKTRVLLLGALLYFIGDGMRYVSGFTFGQETIRHFFLSDGFTLLGFAALLALKLVGLLVISMYLLNKFKNRKMIIFFFIFEGLRTVLYENFSHALSGNYVNLVNIDGVTMTLAELLYNQTYNSLVLVGSFISLALFGHFYLLSRKEFKGYNAILVNLYLVTFFVLNLLMTVFDQVNAYTLTRFNYFIILILGILIIEVLRSEENVSKA